VVPSATYRLFREAIRARKQVTCTYRGLYRELCPHILGHKDGQETALTYQFGGRSSRGLPRAGEWRCLYLAEVRDPRIRAGRWHTGSRHSQTQACVDVVDVDVNLP
jgi:hypothetical protein